MRGSSSVYFNNFASSGEQNLLHDLIIESISIHGQDMMYLPRKITNFDQLYTEDDSSEYTQALQVVMYIESIDGFTGDQRFFMAWAQVWRGKLRDETARQYLLIDPHSPNQYRINGIVRNFPEWYKAFGVKPGDKLYLPPAERVRIW